MRARTNFPRRSGRSRRRASVLVIVLVTLLFATTALVAFIEKASVDLLVETRDATDRRLRQEAYSALEVTLAVIENFRAVNNGLRSPSEGWNDPLGFAGWTPRDGCTAEVSFEDESGKLSLPHVDAQTLVNLFVVWEMKEHDAEKLADALLSWMRKDYVSTSTSTPDYESSALPYGAPLRPMRSYGELRAIDYAKDLFYDEHGQPTDLYGRFVNAVSLFDFKETNVNGGHADVFAAIGSIDETQQRQIGDFLQGTGTRVHQGPSFFQSTSDAASLIGVKALPNGFGTTITALRVNITIKQGAASFRLSAIVAPQGGATTVQQKADPVRDKPAAANATPTNATPTNTPQPSTASQPGNAKKLNYPFTLLEIRENAEISAVPPPPPPSEENPQA